MKVVGILRVKDEADLLPEVLENVASGVEEIYAYDDDSSDGTLEILQAHPAVTHIEPFDPSFIHELQKTRILEQRVKERYPYQTEEVWVALLAGDLFWLNLNPTEAANLAVSKGCDLQNGVAIDFGRWQWDDETDMWPNYPQSLRELCRWCNILEQLPVAWKVADYTVWRRLPWPGGFKKRNVGVTTEFPFLEHQGKRSPKYHQWKYATGSREQPRVGGERVTPDYWTAENAYAHGKSLGYWENTRRIPWHGLDSIRDLVSLYNMSAEAEEATYEAIQDNYQGEGEFAPRTDLSPRTDLRAIDNSPTR